MVLIDKKRSKVSAKFSFNTFLNHFALPPNTKLPTDILRKQKKEPWLFRSGIDAVNATQEAPPGVGGDLVTGDACWGS
jgi:hypothetical protein